MRKHTHRKVRPLINTISFVLDGVTTTPQQDLDKLRLAELACIDQFARGAATVQQWHEMSQMLNLCEVMAMQGIGPEALEACGRAQKWLIDAAERYQRTKKMGMTGEGLTALRDLFAFHDLQRQSISRGEYEKAITTTFNRIRSKAPEVVEL